MISDERYGLHRSLVNCFGERAGDSLFVFVALAIAALRRGPEEDVRALPYTWTTPARPARRVIRRPEYRKVIAWGWNASKDL